MSTETLEAPIAMTQRAAERIREIATRDHIDLKKEYLRVAVVQGGCSGLTYELGWDSVRQDQDTEVALDEIRVLLDRKSALYVEGTQLDFTDGLEGQGFHFLNPQATRTCACGESFSL